MNAYYDTLKAVKARIEHYLTEIFKVYGNELLLRLEDYNLLTNVNNCIETSTATGFIMEEFISSKLEIYTKNHGGKSEIKIERNSQNATVNSSYDCSALFDKIFFMVNIKIQKEGSNNNAVAAINILHDEYVVQNPSQEKAYMLLKVFYDFGQSKFDENRKILIKKIESYFLEEIDFSSGHRQDFRNWSANFNANSGRLQLSQSWRKAHLLAENEISYHKTRQFIDDIFRGLR